MTTTCDTRSIHDLRGVHWDVSKQGPFGMGPVPMPPSMWVALFRSEHGECITTPIIPEQFEAMSADDLVKMLGRVRRLS